MSVNDVQALQKAYPTAALARKAVAEGKITQEQFFALFDAKANDTEFMGLSVESVNQLVDAEAQKRSAAANEKQKAETAEMKKQAQIQADLASGDPAKVAEATLAKAQDNLEKATKLAQDNPEDPKMQEQKTRAEAELEAAKQAYKDVMNNDGGKLGITRIRGEQTVQDQSGNEKTQKIDDAVINYNLGVPKDAGQKWKKDDARAEFNRYTNNTGHDFEIKDKNGNVVDVVKKGEEISGDRLKALKKQVEADYKEAKKAEKKMPSTENRERAQQLYEEVSMIKAAESGKGIGRITKTHNKNVKANQNLIDTQVFYSKEEEKAAKEAAKAAGQEIKTKVAEERDLNVIGHLAKLAKDKIANAPEGERPTTEALWGELARMCEVDKNGNIIGDKPDPEVVKNALIDITGAGAQLSISEMKEVAAETGCSDGDVRHAFRAFGFEAERPIGKKLANAAKAAAPAAAMTLASMLIKNKKTAKTEANGHNEKTVNYHAEDTQIVEGVNTTTTNTTTITNTVTPGTTEAYFNEETGLWEYHETAGTTTTTSSTSTSTTEDPFKAIAHAEVSGSVTAAVDVSVQAIATAVAKGTPLLGAALTGYEFIKGLVKTPYEKSVVNGVDMYKVTHFTEMVKGADNKKVASQIQQMVGGITGDKDMDAKIITAVLNQENGSQNNYLDKRELEAVYQDLKEIQKNFKNAKAADLTPITEPEKPVTPPVVEPEKKPELGLEERTVIVEIPYIQYGGPWHYSQLYVNDDGSKLSEPDRKLVQKHLQNNHLSVDAKAKKAKLDNEIELPNGKKVKLAGDAAAQAEKMKGKSGGKNVRFEHNQHGEGRVLVDGKPAPGPEGQWKPIDKARADFERMKAEQEK